MLKEIVCSKEKSLNRVLKSFRKLLWCSPIRCERKSWCYV